MAYSRSRGPARIRFDEQSFHDQEHIREDRVYSAGTDDVEDEYIDRFRSRSSLSESFAHDSLEDFNSNDMKDDENWMQQRDWRKQCMLTTRGRLRSSIKWAVPLLLLAGLGGGVLEYRRLNRRAAGFEKAWNPITESFTEFYEGEKKASKQVVSLDGIVCVQSRVRTLFYYTWKVGLMFVATFFLSGSVSFDSFVIRIFYSKFS